jgi:two-component system alkaline phosphatase synthesis response regulator PhoP
LRLTVSDLLASEGHAVETAADGPTGLLKGVNRELDLIILDVMLPGKNGYDVLKELRKQGCDTAILMLTAKGRVMDRVVGLKLGADDYLAKPFDPTELLARVEALLRRVTKKGRVGVARFEFNSVEADFESGLVRKNGEPVSLAAKELQLLRYLIDRRGVVVTREDLLRHVWEYQSDVSSRTIDVHVAWLRQKLEDNPQSPKYIQTVRGVGYRFST